MKFKRVSTIDERFSTEYSKQKHYDQHVTKEKQYKKLTPDEYESIADRLAATPIDYKNILGYETTAPKHDSRRRFVKYNVLTQDFVVYGLDDNNEPVIISLHKKTLREYNIDRAIKYIDEVPEVAS